MKNSGIVALVCALVVVAGYMINVPLGHILLVLVGGAGGIALLSYRFK